MTIQGAIEEIKMLEVPFYAEPIKAKIIETIIDECRDYYYRGKADAIDDCKTILRSRHMFRTCEDDYNAKIEAPFYKGLWKAFDQLKEQNK